MHRDSGTQRGIALIEALAALVIVAMVVLQFLGIRTTALIDATKARNWRLAREIAEERLSELQAGAHEVKPRSGETISLEEKYRGFSYKIVIGETAVTNAESEVADNAAGGSSEADEKLQWQRDREMYRKASAQGLSRADYQDKLIEDEERRNTEEKPPSEDEFEEVAIVVYFPKLDPQYPDQKEGLLIKSRVSTLAIWGLTPEQATSVAAAMGKSTGNGGTGSSGTGSGGTGSKSGGSTGGGK